MYQRDMEGGDRRERERERERERSKGILLQHEVVMAREELLHKNVPNKPSRLGQLEFHCQVVSTTSSYY